MLIEVYANQPPSKSFIFIKRMESFVKSTASLQLFCLASLWICYINFLALKEAEEVSLIIHLFFCCYFFTLIITTQLDAYSRYQNYKMAKDLLHQYGFKKPLVRLFSKSKCQREAIAEAANCLSLKKEVNDYFYSMGFRWYHILPHIILKKPQVFFTKEYWMSTFFVPNYKSKFFYW
ncbi:MAG TPA: hypothetical protein VN182_05960 [Flavobacterium sp.]|nr:hypothetical protein [Flavobacterium sp.]